MNRIWGIAEVVKSAGKNFAEMANEPADETKHEKENLQLKSELDKMQKKIKDDRLVIEKLKTDLAKSAEKIATAKPDGMIDFKIIIGLEDSAKLLEMLKNSEKQAQALKSNNERLLSDNLKLKEEKNIFQDSLKFEKSVTESLRKKLETTQSTLSSTDINLDSLQDTLLHLRKVQKNSYEKLYTLLKKGFAALGIPISQNLPIETLGFEDLEEFFQIQANQILSIAAKINLELKGKFGIYEIRSLDEVHSAVKKVTEECSLKVSEYKEIAMAAEKLIQNSQREASELQKKFFEQMRTIETLQKSLVRLETENKTIKESLEETERIQSEHDQIKVICKKITDDSIEKQKKYEEDSKKFEKTYEYLIYVEKQLSEYKAKARTFASILEEKEKQNADLKKEKEILLSQVHDLKQYSSAEALSTKLYHENIIKKMTEEFLSDKRSFETRLKGLQKDSEELQAAKIKISEHNKGIQEFHKVLSDLQGRINKMTKKNENLTEENERLIMEMQAKERSLEKEIGKYEEVIRELKGKVQEYEERFKDIAIQVKESETMKREASELLEKVQSKVANEDNLVDRRIVTTFLINFLNDANTEKMKIQMLKPFAEILGLDHQQRVKIGLDQEPGLLSQFTNFLTRG